MITPTVEHFLMSAQMDYNQAVWHLHYVVCPGILVCLVWLALATYWVFKCDWDLFTYFYPAVFAFFVIVYLAGALQHQNASRRRLNAPETYLAIYETEAHLRALRAEIP